MNQGDLIENYRTKENTYFFLCAHKTYTKTHHIPGYTISLNTLKNKKSKSYEVYSLRIVKLTWDSAIEKYLKNPQIFEI